MHETQRAAIIFSASYARSKQRMGGRVFEPTYFTPQAVNMSKFGCLLINNGRPISSNPQILQQMIGNRIELLNKLDKNTIEELLVIKIEILNVRLSSYFLWKPGLNEARRVFHLLMFDSIFMG